MTLKKGEKIMKEEIVSILELKPGEKGRVCEVFLGRDGAGGYGYRHRYGRCYGRRMREVLGLYQGQVLEVVENRGFGPVIVKVGNSRFILGRGQAARILVKPIKWEEVKP